MTRGYNITTTTLRECQTGLMPRSLSLGISHYYHYYHHYHFYYSIFIIIIIIVVITVIIIITVTIVIMVCLKLLTITIIVTSVVICHQALLCFCNESWRAVFYFYIFSCMASHMLWQEL